MRKILFIIFLFCAVQLVAQTDKEKEKFLSKIASSDVEIADTKKGNEPKIWFNRAELFINIYDMPRKNLVLGLPALQIKIMFKDEKIRRTDNVEIDGTAYEVYIYADKKLYFDETGKLVMWEIDDKVVSKPLLKAFEAYSKAYELDIKKVYEKKIKERLTALSASFLQDAAFAYNLHKFDISLQSFESSLAVSEHPTINLIDSANIYNAGLVARLADNSKKALEYYQKSIKIGYDGQGNTYASYAALLRESGDTIGSRDILAQAFIKYPKNQEILIQLINSYLAAGKDLSEAIPYIKDAQINEPDNASLYNAEGIIYERLKNLEKAAECYMKALEIKEDYFEAQYSLGALYYNYAVELQNDAAKVPDNEYAKYEKLIEKMKAEFKKSLPYLTRAHELLPEELSIVESLKSVYYRFHEESDEMNKKFEYFKNLSAEMANKSTE